MRFPPVNWSRKPVARGVVAPQAVSFPLTPRSRIMHGLDCRGKGISGLAIAILPFAGLSKVQPSSPRTVRWDDWREAKPIAPDLVRAIRDADDVALLRVRID